MVVTARNPLNTNAATLPQPPAFAFSGVVGASQTEHDSYLRPLVSHDTLDSTIELAATSQVLGLRVADAIGPASSFSAGIVAAASVSGTDGGVTSLAEFLDPSEPQIFYTTKSGDSLSTIAQTFGLSLDSILNNNATVTDADAIVLDQILLLPRVDGILHLVSSGDTLTGIVDQYDDVTIDDIVDYSPNKIESSDDLKRDQYVLLPGASFKPPPPPPPPPPASSNGGTTGAPPAQGNGLFDYPLPAGSWTIVSDDFGSYRGPGSIHTGIDVTGFRSAPVYSACDGVVTKAAWWTYSYGYHVIVDCGDGWTTLYAHFGDILVVEGQPVVSGTQIGVTGSTGYSTGEHLHFEIRQDGNYYDPSIYLPGLYP